MLAEACGATKEYEERLKVLVDYMAFAGRDRPRGGRSERSRAEWRSGPRSRRARPWRTRDAREAAPGVPSDLEEFVFILDPRLKRRVIVHAPHDLSSKELARVRNRWMCSLRGMKPPRRRNEVLVLDFDVCLAATQMNTRFEPEEIPFGRRTAQLRSFSSTHITSLALQGGWSVGVSNSTNPGPSWATGMQCPFKSKLILTSAECPQWLLD